MFEKILYPTDFSDVSKKALDYLAQLKDAGTKEIVVLHVIDEKGIDAISRYGSGSAQTVIGRIEEEAREEGKKIEKKLGQSGLTVKVRIEVGVPLKEILKVEEEEKVSDAPPHNIEPHLDYSGSQLPPSYDCLYGDEKHTQGPSV